MQYTTIILIQYFIVYSTKLCFNTCVCVEYIILFNNHSLIVKKYETVLSKPHTDNSCKMLYKIWLSTQKYSRSTTHCELVGSICKSNFNKITPYTSIPILHTRTLCIIFRFDSIIVQFHICRLCMIDFI